MKEYICIESPNEVYGGMLVRERELILCKNCIHFDGYYCHNKKWGDEYGNYTPPIKSEDGFCDWADRKHEEK